jgi:hypothetical protein
MLYAPPTTFWIYFVGATSTPPVVATDVVTPPRVAVNVHDIFAPVPGLVSVPLSVVLG